MSLDGEKQPLLTSGPAQNEATPANPLGTPPPYEEPARLGMFEAPYFSVSLYLVPLVCGSDKGVCQWSF